MLSRLFPYFHSSSANTVISRSVLAAQILIFRLLLVDSKMNRGRENWSPSFTTSVPGDLNMTICQQIKMTFQLSVCMHLIICRLDGSVCRRGDLSLPSFLHTLPYRYRHIFMTSGKICIHFLAFISVSRCGSPQPRLIVDNTSSCQGSRWDKRRKMVVLFL